MRRMSIRAVVVGTGYAGQRHAAVLRELGIAFEGPLSAREVVSAPSAIARPGLVVHVCASNDLHAPLVSAALAAGSDVVCEKPLALDAVTAADLASRAQASGRLAVLAYGYRFHPMAVELVARAAAGDIGEIHDVRGGFLQDWLLSASDDNWRVDAKRGGASRVVADIGSHWLDLAELATGRRVEAVVAQIGRLHGRATEDHASLLIRFAGGLGGSCVLSQASAGHANDFDVSIDGAEGSLRWRFERPDELVIGSRGATRILSRGPELRSSIARELASRKPGPNEGRRNLLAAVYEQLDRRAGPLPLPTFADGVRHLRFADAALVSARTRAWVDVV